MNMQTGMKLSVAETALCEAYDHAIGDLPGDGAVLAARDTLISDFKDAAVTVAEFFQKRSVEMQPSRRRARVGDAKHHVVFLGELGDGFARDEGLAQGGEDVEGNGLLFETRAVLRKIFEREAANRGLRIDEAQRGRLGQRDGEFERVGFDEGVAPGFVRVVSAREREEKKRRQERSEERKDAIPAQKRRAGRRRFALHGAG